MPRETVHITYNPKFLSIKRARCFFNKTQDGLQDIFRPMALFNCSTMTDSILNIVYIFVSVMCECVREKKKIKVIIRKGDIKDDDMNHQITTVCVRVLRGRKQINKKKQKNNGIS